MRPTFNFEVVPLHVSSCVWIHSHKNIVLILVYFDGGVKVSTLKRCIESDWLLIFKSRVHPLKKTRVFGSEMFIKFTEIGCQVREVCIDDWLVLILVIFIDLLMHFETAHISCPYTWDNQYLSKQPGRAICCRK